MNRWTRGLGRKGGWNEEDEPPKTRGGRNKWGEVGQKWTPWSHCLYSKIDVKNRIHNCGAINTLGGVWFRQKKCLK